MYNNTQNRSMSPIEEERYICAKDIVLHLFIVGWSAHLNSEAHAPLLDSCQSLYNGHFWRVNYPF